MHIRIHEGAVTQDGQALGRIHEGTCHLRSGIAPHVKAAINRAHGQKLTFVTGAAPAPTAAAKSGAETEVPLPAVSTSTNSDDPMPARDLILGAKCPNLIAWKNRQPKGDA